MPAKSETISLDDAIKKAKSITRCVQGGGVGFFRVDHMDEGTGEWVHGVPARFKAARRACAVATAEKITRLYLLPRGYDPEKITRVMAGLRGEIKGSATDLARAYIAAVTA